MELGSLKILVTGSSGIIGNCLCEALLEKNIKVFGADITHNRWNEEVHKRTFYIDLRDPNALKNLPTDFDMVIHFAANARVYNLVIDPDLAKDNFLILYNTMEFVRKSGIKKVLFSSSREVYGNSEHIICPEHKAFTKRCESPYTAMKIAGEALLQAYHLCYGIDFIITRFSNVYGKFDYSDRAIPLFILKASQHQDIRIYGGDKILDFTYVEDTVDGTIKAIEHFEISKNEIYNIATQKGYSIKDVAQLIIKIINSKSRIVCGGDRTGEVCSFVADISKAKAVLKYSPKFTLHEGIAKTIEWYLPRIAEYEKEIMGKR